MRKCSLSASRGFFFQFLASAGARLAAINVDFRLIYYHCKATQTNPTDLINLDFLSRQLEVGGWQRQGQGQRQDGERERERERERESE